MHVKSRTKNGGGGGGFKSSNGVTTQPKTENQTFRGFLRNTAHMKLLPTINLEVGPEVGESLGDKLNMLKM